MTARYQSVSLARMERDRTISSLVSYKHISCSVHCTNHDLLLTGLRLKFFPETVNIYVQRVVFHVGQVSPRRLDQIFSGRDQATAAHEQFEQAKLFPS